MVPPWGECLYIPEMFSVARRITLYHRRLEQWSPLLHDPNPGQWLMLLVAEIKDVLPARDGHQLRFKHLPGVAFSVSQQILDALLAQHEHALNLWRADTSLHLLMMSTFGLDAQGRPQIEEPAMMLTTEQWLPVADTAERQLVATLVQHNRRFIKAVHEGSPTGTLASISLLDCGAEPVALFIDRTQRTGMRSTRDARIAATHPPSWWWRPQQEAMPPLPGLRT